MVLAFLQKGSTVGVTDNQNKYQSNDDIYPPYHLNLLFIVKTLYSVKSFSLLERFSTGGPRSSFRWAAKCSERMQ